MKLYNIAPSLRLFLIVVVLPAWHVLMAQNVSSGASQDAVLDQAEGLFSASTERRQRAIRWMRERNQQDVIAPLIYALRYSRDDRHQIVATLERLSGENRGDDWFAWMLWQQANPQVVPFEGFDRFQSDLFVRIDPNFRVFLYPGVKHEIRLEEIVWGGVLKDGIPALINPELIPANQASYLQNDELVFGVEIDGDARAYPYRIMDWHEMFNDVVGGVPVALAYCTLCGSGILFDTRMEGGDEPFVFGSSGFLYRSNKLMYDKQTNSLWNQFTGRPVVGKLTGSDIQLPILPVITTTWAEWLSQNPHTKVLSLDTGHIRDYSPGRAYGSYFNSPELMFPALTPDKRLKIKDQIFGLRITGARKAWPLTVFAGGQVINDRIGIIDIVLVGDSRSRMVRAYRSGGRKFQKQGASLDTIQVNGEIWKVTEAALEGPRGQTLSRLPGHLAYWFAWSGYFPNAELSN